MNEKSPSPEGDSVDAEIQDRQRSSKRLVSWMLIGMVAGVIGTMVYGFTQMALMIINAK